jgi:hypothetical protein
MLALIGALLFALAFVLNLAHASPPAILSPPSLMYAGLFFTALHLAFLVPLPWRRSVPPQ